MKQHLTESAFFCRTKFRWRLFLCMLLFTGMGWSQSPIDNPNQWYQNTNRIQCLDACSSDDSARLEKCQIGLKEYFNDCQDESAIKFQNCQIECKGRWGIGSGDSRTTAASATQSGGRDSQPDSDNKSVNGGGDGSSQLSSGHGDIGAVPVRGAKRNAPPEAQTTAPTIGMRAIPQAYTAGDTQGNSEADKLKNGLEQALGGADAEIQPTTGQIPGASPALASGQPTHPGMQGPASAPGTTIPSAAGPGCGPGESYLNGFCQTLCPSGTQESGTTNGFRTCVSNANRALVAPPYGRGQNATSSPAAKAAYSSANKPTQASGCISMSDTPVICMPPRQLVLISGPPYCKQVCR